MSQWSQKLDVYLAKTKMSKKQLAEQIGVSINTLQKWWRNREPSPESVTKIEQLLSENHHPTAEVAGEPVTSQADATDQDSGVLDQRFDEKSVFISLLRTTCPFCETAIERSRGCPYCGQHFVWANIPIKNS